MNDILNTDTIAAISTGYSSGGIAVIRISGKDAFSSADRIFRGMDSPLSSCASHTVHYGHIVDPSLELIVDEVLVSIFRAPRTYTREDVVEISCHGGMFVARKILSLLFEYVRPAEPGEFTKRAFLNGRIDLSEANAVADIISSDNDRYLLNAERQLSGVLAKKVEDFRSKIVHEAAFIESAVDDPENYSLDGYGDVLSEKVDELIKGLSDLSETFSEGRIMKEGVETLIIGKPNVGKSSILNCLSRNESAIVTDIPGTTRDLISEKIRLSGITLNLIDSAGVHEADDRVEAIGVERTLSKIDEAKLIIFAVDSSEELDENDYHIFEKIRGKNVIVLLNKSDKPQALSEGSLKKLADLSKYVLRFSAKNGDGIEKLGSAISDIIFSGKGSEGRDIIITDERQKAECDNAVRSLLLVKRSIEDGLSEDFFTQDLMDAYDALGRIIGKGVSEDLIEEIFSKFCMGK